MKYKTLLMGALFASSLMGISYIDCDEAYATEIVTATPNTSIEQQYNFCPKFIPGKTKLETFGTSFEKVTAENLAGKTENAYVLVNMPDSLNGKIGANYINVGTYNGKQVDLNIRFNSWERYRKGDYGVRFDLDRIGVSSTNIFLDQTWTLIDHETGKPLDIEGFYLTFGDIDGDQYVQLDTKNVNKIYKDKSCYLEFLDESGDIKMVPPRREASEDDDKKSMATVTMNGNQMNFAWGKDLDRIPVSPDYEFDYSKKPNLIVATGDYLWVTGERPVKIDPAKVIKITTDSDETDVVKNTLKTDENGYYYEISHYVPDELKEFYYQNYMIEDDILDELDIKNVEIMNDSGQTVTSLFDIQHKNNHLVVTAKKESLANPNFYHHTYTVKVNVNIKEGADLESYRKGDYYVLPNTATVTVNDKKEISNIVETLVPKKPEGHFDLVSDEGEKVPGAEITVTDKTTGESFDWPDSGNLNDLPLEEDHDYVVSVDVPSGWEKPKDVEFTVDNNHITTSNGEIIEDNTIILETKRDKKQPPVIDTSNSQSEKSESSSEEDSSSTVTTETITETTSSKEDTVDSSDTTSSSEKVVNTPQESTATKEEVVKKVPVYLGRDQDNNDDNNQGSGKGSGNGQGVGLPQTGNEENKAMAGAGAMLVGLGSLFGLSMFRRRKEN